MKLSLQGIGRIEKAAIEISGITVIAGLNETGKSTVGRALFSVFNSFYKIRRQIKSERLNDVSTLLQRMYQNLTNRPTMFDLDFLAEEILKNIDLYKNRADELKAAIIRFILKYDDSFAAYIDYADIDMYCSRIRESLNISDADIVKTLLKRHLSSEFYGQINNVYYNGTGEIRLSVKDKNISVLVENNSVKEVSGNIELNTETIYIDDPFVLDKAGLIHIYKPNIWDLDHRSHLVYKLNAESNKSLIDEIIAGHKFESIYKKISEVCSGDFVRRSNSSFGYKQNNSDRIIDVRNLSTGFKTFSILKKLLLNGSIEYNGTVILDEPEIHLHPEWQLLLAEIIVLIHKEFNIHILLNTHSPYFLNALEVYSAKYGIIDKCKYYLSRFSGDNVQIDDVTDNIEAIYDKLAQPLQRLDNERYSL